MSVKTQELVISHKDSDGKLEGPRERKSEGDEKENWYYII